MTASLAVVVVAAIGAPHVARLEQVTPALAVVIWLAALLLRAIAAILCALFIIRYLPQTEIFALLTGWCWHSVLPFLEGHLPVDGHALGDVAVMLPAVVLAASLVSVVVGIWRAGRRVRRLINRSAVGRGPHECLLIADGEVMIAAAGLRSPRVVVSAGALVVLDDEELAASLEHEHGHIAHRHRYVLVVAELCRSLARFLPGTRYAVRELLFHVERDADRYAISRAHDPAALASAICKVAQASPFSAPALSLGGGVVVRRLRLLLESEPNRRRGLESPLRALAAAMLALVALGASALPAAAHAGLHRALATPHSEHHAAECPHERTSSG